MHDNSVESKKRIRANIRLELETRAREIEDLENEIKKDPSPEKEERLAELREYYEKLKAHYETISGMDLETASKLKVINLTTVRNASWLKRIYLSISAFLLAGGYYNLMIQGLEGYELNDVIIDISSGFLVNNFLFFLTKLVSEPAIFLILGLLISGSIFNLSGSFIPHRTNSDLLEGLMIGVLNLVLTYSLLGYYIDLLGKSDIEWIFYTMAFVVGALIILVAFSVFLAAFKSTAEINDFKVLGFLEAIFLFVAGTAYIYGYVLGDENILYQWPNTFLLLFSAFLVRGIRMLLKKEQK